MKPKDILTKDLLIFETQNGLTDYEIAKKYNIKTEKSVSNYFLKYGIKKNTSRKSQTLNLIELDMDSFKKDFIKMNLTNMAKKYKVCIGTIKKIIIKHDLQKTCNKKLRFSTNIKNKCKICEKTVERNDYVYCSRVCHDRGTKRHIYENFSQLTSVTCYWGGFIFGDGSVNTKGELKVGLANNESNRVLLEKLSFLVFKKNYVLYYDHMIQLSIVNREVCENLSRHFNINPNKTYNHVLNIPNNFSRDFVRGYFDADGWISTTKQTHKSNGKLYDKLCWGICSYLRENLEKIKEIIPVESYICKKSTQELYELRITSRANIIKIANYLYSTDSVCLERKRCKMLSLS